MLEDDDVRAIFFDTDDFAKVVTIRPNGADAFTINAIFDRRPLSPRAIDGAQVGFDKGMKNTGNAPQLRCRTSDIPGVKAARCTVTVDGQDYSVWEVQPDYTGLTTLILKVA